MDRKLYSSHARKSIPEGLVLLENNGALPLVEHEKIALFGRGQFEYIKSGSGSGGKVRCQYVTQLADELKKRVELDQEVYDYHVNFVKNNPFDAGDGWWCPECQKEVEISEELANNSSNRCDKAIIIITRMCGESFDLKKEKGSWYLSDREENLIKTVVKYFKNVIVLLNCGNVLDMSWVKKYEIGTVMYIWQGGQEGAAGTVDALMNDTPPSGKLTDTIAKDIEDYPSTKYFGDEKKNYHVEDIFVGYRYFETFAKDKVLYPFGYGVGYTKFDIQCNSVDKKDDIISISILVKNIGENHGKEVVQIYISAPCGKLGKSARELVAFKKTNLLKAGESQTLSLTVKLSDFASYDDSGATGYPYSFVLEDGEYKVFLGNSVRDAKQVYSFCIDKTICIKKCSQALAPEEEFDRMVALSNGEVGYSKVPIAKYVLKEKIQNNLPAEIKFTGDKGIKLIDVKGGKNNLDEFIAQLTNQELCSLVKGEGMNSMKAVMPGTGCVFGGLTDSLKEKGIPTVTGSDGPSGLRLECDAVAVNIPTGVLIASSFAPEQFEDVFTGFAEELKEYSVDVVLGSGMNIHRNPLCGRNFEYFSEDPYLTGKIAENISKYFTKQGVYTTIKHFAVNSQEFSRQYADEVVSERALREIYLKGFEIAVKSGYAKTIMTSYNRVNGRSTGGSYDLTTSILRDEWGYDGFVMTDWWTHIDSPIDGSFNTENVDTMVKAQNDIYMVTSDTMSQNEKLLQSLESGYLTRGELQRSVKNLLNFIMETEAMRKGYFHKLKDFSADANEVVVEKTPENNVVTIDIQEEGVYYVVVKYKSNLDELVQSRVRIYVNEVRNNTLIINGTNGKTTEKRTRLFLPKNAKIKFTGEFEIESVKILK